MHQRVVVRAVDPHPAGAVAQGGVAAGRGADEVPVELVVPGAVVDQHPVQAVTGDQVAVLLGPRTPASRCLLPVGLLPSRWQNR